MKNRLPEILRQKSISVTELSKETGIGRTTLSELNNSSKIPDKTKVGTLSSIAKTLKIPMSQIFPDEPLEISVIKKITYQNGEHLFDNPLYELYKSNPDTPSKLLKYLGVIFVRIETFKMPLLVGYNGDSLGNIFFEILSGADLALLYLSSREVSASSYQFASASSINDDSRFIEMISAEFIKRLLDNLLKSDVLNATLSSVFSNKNTLSDNRSTPSLSSSICINTIPVRGPQNTYQFEKRTNGIGTISSLIAEIYISKIASKDEADFLRGLLK